MRYRYLIKHKGELHLVNDLAGYKGHKLMGKNVPRPPSDHCRWEMGRWVEDKEAKTKARRHAELLSMSRPKIVEMLENRLDKLEQMVAELQARVPGQQRKV